MSAASDPERQLLRHTVATVAYRAGKALRGAPPSFASFTIGEKPKTPAQILAHLGDLFDWAHSMAVGKQVWKDSQPREWDAEVARFFAALQKFDELLASDAALHAPMQGLFQGPIADALTHVGQIAMLRRLAGCAIKGENYYAAEIAVGRVGADQAAPKREF
jgi:hypothetical protein